MIFACFQWCFMVTVYIICDRTVLIQIVVFPRKNTTSAASNRSFAGWRDGHHSPPRTTMISGTHNMNAHAIGSSSFMVSTCTGHLQTYHTRQPGYVSPMQHTALSGREPLPPWGFRTYLVLRQVYSYMDKFYFLSYLHLHNRASVFIADHVSPSVPHLVSAFSGPVRYPEPADRPIGVSSACHLSSSVHTLPQRLQWCVVGILIPSTPPDFSGVVTIDPDWQAGQRIIPSPPGITTSSRLS